MSEKHRIRISRGNRKLGTIPSLSFPPGITCAPDAPCAHGQCYVMKNMLSGPYGKNIAASYQANLDFFNECRLEFFTALRKYLKRARPEFFRFHVSGDFIDAGHLLWCVDIAKGSPDTRFLAFTKRYELLPPAAKIPDNFSVIVSMWPGYGRVVPGYRCAWMDDGTENRIPANALQCPGLCDSCGMCWNLRSIGRDVVFGLH